MSDSALLARFFGLTPPDAQTRVASLYKAISSAGIAGIRNLHPAYTTLLVVYDPLVWTPTALVQRLESARKSAGSTAAKSRRTTIPVCFAEKFAPDLAAVAAGAGYSVDQAIQMIATAAFRVAFLGFAPGFPYLLGLPPALAAPRLASPRTRVEAGSVGIAGDQTGIYPAPTPGGWRIVGRTPLRLFNPARKPMSLVLTGDEVRFEAIDERKYKELSQW